MNNKILFVISDTGGGHRSAASAIIAALRERGAQATCEMVDLLRVSGIPGIRSAPELYAFFSSGHIWLHNFLFRLSNSSLYMNVASRFLYGFARRHIREAVEAFGPDLVVVIHPLAVRAMCAYRDESRAAWPVVTVVTDLVSIHASWLCPEADLNLLPTPEAVTLAVKSGIPADRTLLTGFPVHPRFLGAVPVLLAARQALGLPPDRFTLLLASGGAGGGPVETLVEELERECPDCTLLVIAGRNRRLMDKLNGRAASSPHTLIFGFVENMEQLMAASDVVITKAGPGTIMEAAALARTVILTGALGLQEEGNIGFVLKSGLGYHCPTPSAVSQTVRLLADGKIPFASGHATVAAGARSIASVLMSRTSVEGVKE